MSRRGHEGAVTVPARPVIELILDAQGRGTVDGRLVAIEDPADPQASLLAEAVRRSRSLGRPVRVRALDPDRVVWHLVAHPDGTVSELGDDEPEVADAAPDDPPAGWPLRVHPTGEIVALVDEFADEPEAHPVAAAAPAPPTPLTPAPLSPAPFPPEPPEDLTPAEPPPAVPAPAAAAPPAPPAPETSATTEVSATPEPPAPSAAPPVEAPPEPSLPEHPAARTPERVIDLDALADQGTGYDAEAEEFPYESSDPYTHVPQDDQYPAAVGYPEPEPADDEPVAGPHAWLIKTPHPRIQEPAHEQEPDHRQEPDHQQEPVHGSGPADVQEPVREHVARHVREAVPRDTPVPEDADTPTRPRRPGVDGLLGDLRTAHHTTPRPRRRTSPGWVRPAALAGAAAVAVGSTVLVLTSGDGGSGKPAAAASSSSAGAARAASRTPSASVVPADPARSAPAPLEKPPATLSVGPPPGFRNTPLWAMPISPASTSLVSSDGRVLALTNDGQVALIDPVTGAARWHAPVAPGATGPHLARVDGRDVAVVLTAEQLTYWPLPPATSHGESADTGAGISIDLPAGTAVSWSGPSPLLVLADGTAGVIRNGGLQRTTLPSGMKPLAADGADVLAVSGHDWIRQPAGQAPGTPGTFAAPEGGTGTAPIRVENIGGGYFGTAWAGSKGPVVAAYDAHTGRMMVHQQFSKDVDFSRAPAVHEVGSDRTVLGNALFEPAQANLSILPTTFTPVTLTPGHVFVDDVSGVVVDLQLKGKDMKTVPFSGKNPIVPVGITTSGGRAVAVVAVPQGNGWLLCGLPAE